MGQYHRISIVDHQSRVRTIERRRFGGGVKLAEQLHRNSIVVAAVAALVTDGLWADGRFVIVGDYGEDEDLANSSVAGFDVDELYSGENAVDDTDHARQLLAAQGFEFCTHIRDIRQSAIDELRQYYPHLLNGLDDNDAIPEHYHSMLGIWGPERREHHDARHGYVLANLDNGEHLDPATFGSDDTWDTMGHYGGVWAAALSMCAASDGRGGGDFGHTHARRWLGCHIAPVHRDQWTGTDITEIFIAQLDDRDPEWFGIGVDETV